MEIDWSREWLASLLWVARVFVFTVIGFVLVAWFRYGVPGGAAVLAALGHVLHSAPTELAQLAPDPDGCVVAAVDGDVRPARCRLSYQATHVQRCRSSTHDILEDDRDLRHPGNCQCDTRTHHVLGRPGTDHSLAAVA